MKLILDRFCLGREGDMGTFAVLRFNHRRFVTVEPNWRGNAVNVSCIPTGSYALNWRRSGVVERASGGMFKYGWEVAAVPNRSYIMLHPGNHMDHLEGCIAPGVGLGYIDDLWAVTDSREAFKQIMGAIPRDEDNTLMVRTRFSGEL